MRWRGQGSGGRRLTVPAADAEEKPSAARPARHFSFHKNKNEGNLFRGEWTAHKFFEPAQKLRKTSFSCMPFLYLGKLEERWMHTTPPTDANHPQLVPSVDPPPNKNELINQQNGTDGQTRCNPQAQRINRCGTQGIRTWKAGDWMRLGGGLVCWEGAQRV